MNNGIAYSLECVGQAASLLNHMLEYLDDYEIPLGEELQEEHKKAADALEQLVLGLTMLMFQGVGLHRLPVEDGDDDEAPLSDDDLDG